MDLESIFKPWISEIFPEVSQNWGASNDLWFWVELEFKGHTSMEKWYIDFWTDKTKIQLCRWDGHSQIDTKLGQWQISDPHIFPELEQTFRNDMKEYKNGQSKANHF